MKLVKNISQKSEDGQCMATTNKGSRCKREAVRQGFCNQHYKLMKEQGMVVDVKGDEKLSDVPPAPEKLDKTGRRSWHMYCQYLIDTDRLYQVYLPGIANLCYLEDQLEETKDNIEDMGAVNIYENGIQRNGYASHFDKLLGHIRNLRSDYGLTLASDKSAGAGAGESAQPKQGYESSKAKNY